MNRTSSTSQSVQFDQIRVYVPRKRNRKERFASWYMGRIAGRYCPCEWPIKIRWLIQLCGRIDDEWARSDFRDFAHFHFDWKL